MGFCFFYFHVTPYFLFKLQSNKVAETAGNLICYIFAPQDAHVHFDEGKLEAIDM